MKTFGHILFPVDFSERCAAAIPLVASWTQRFNAKLTLLHTVQVPISAYGGADAYPIVIDVPAIEKQCQERLDQIELQAAERIVTVGDPALEVIKYTEKN